MDRTLCKSSLQSEANRQRAFASGVLSVLSSAPVVLGPTGQTCNTELDSVYDLAMASVDAIPIPLPHVGSVNAWLLRGEPLTVVDTGPRSDQALDAIERGLR